MNRLITLAVLLSILTSTHVQADQQRTFNVRDYGTTGDGKTLDTAALNKTIQACATAGGGVVTVPPGRYLTGTVHLKSNITLHLEPGAELIGTRDLAQYQSFTPPKGTPLVGGRVEWHRAIVLGDGVENVSITGQGVINGANVTDPLGEENTRGPHAVLFGNSRNITLRDLSIRDAGNYAALFEFTNSIAVRNLKITGGYDGVHLRGWTDQPCRDVAITDCLFSTGDDCIAGWHWADVLIDRCTMNSACNGIRLFGPARKVIVHACLFYGPGKYPWRTSGPLNWRNMAAGITIQPSAWGETPGLVDDIKISNVTMHDLATPVHIVNKGPSEIGHVSIDRLTATGVYRAAIAFESWTDKPIRQVDLRDATIEFTNRSNLLNPMESAKWFTMAKSIDAITAPGIDSRPLPTWGLYARHVKMLNLSDVRLHAAKLDDRPAVMLDRIDTLSIEDLKCPKGTPPMVLREAKPK